MDGYKQLTQEKRYQIYAFKKAGWSQSAIARELGMHPSTISRELKRNTGGRGYRPQQAHRLAKQRQQQRACGSRISEPTWQWIEARLREEWSPEQIAGRLRRMNRKWHSAHECVSHERIYQYVYADKKVGGTLYRHLRCQKKRRKRYGSGRSRRGQIAGRVCISERAPVVEQRIRVGDWEGDTIIGKAGQQAIVSLSERFSRYTLLHKVETKSATAVSGAMVEQMHPVREKIFTVTMDNGKEFAGHQEVAAALDAQTYFAHPYASWERGLNENTNGLVRQYCPKKCDFTLLSQDEVQAIAQRLNHRPRKVLDYKTPFEVFFELENVALNT